MLRRPEARAALEAALGDVDRLVLLGDVLELRHGPVVDALDAARPFFEGIGAALPAHAEVVLLAGNHDHALIAPWLERRSFERREPLALEQRAGPDASPATTRIAEWIGGGRLDVAYPGVWLRPDVYALHGHYLDRHFTVPTSERLAAGIMARVLGLRADAAAAPDDYETVLAPLYAWLHVIARTTGGFGAQRQRATQNAWKVLRAQGRRPIRQQAFVAAFPVAVWAANRAGLGPVKTDVSPRELRRAGVRAMGLACARLGIDAEWVIFGHTHRTGPRSGDEEAEWRAPTGARLLNTGCWVHERAFLGASGAKRNPYWPGTIAELDDDGPPRLRNLLEDFEL